VQKDGSLVATIGPLECELAATMVPDPLATRLARVCARRRTNSSCPICKRPCVAKRVTASPPKWQAGYSAGTLANQAMFLPRAPRADGNAAYRNLVVAIADQYLASQPEEDVDAWPASFRARDQCGVAAWRFAKKRSIWIRAQVFAQWPWSFYWQDNPSAAREASRRGTTKTLRRRLARARAAESPRRRTTRLTQKITLEHHRPMKTHRLFLDGRAMILLIAAFIDPHRRCRRHS
jgi:hypothetical protein